MLIIKFLAYILCSYGFSEMVVFGRGPFSIFERWRNFTMSISKGLGELFTCMLCFPTWVGFGFSIIDILIPSVVFTPFNIIFGGGGGFLICALIVILDMLFTSGTTWLLYQLETYFENHKVIVYKDGVKYIYKEDDGDEDDENIETIDSLTNKK